MKCDIVLPVGPGHEETHMEAVNSVKIAAMNKGQFESISIRVVDDTKGELGRSKARNMGVQESDADWIFFLDADDLMHPYAFEAKSRHPYLDALWGNIWEIGHGVTAWRYQIPQIKTYQELISFPPYYTLQMGHFVKREVALKHPFDEEMNCGEDFKYYLEVWKNHNCLKIDEPLFLNRKGHHSTGPRSATGRDWNQAVASLLEEARNPEQKYKEKFGYLFPIKDTHFTQGTFELGHLPACLDACKGRRVALDIGAHVGSWSKALSEDFETVHSFEADPDNFHCLTVNSPASINHHNAVGNDDKAVHIQESDRGNTGNGYIQDGGEVQMIRLDDAMNLDALDFMKIDVEGYEPEVLRGAEGLIKQFKPVILIEQTPGTDMRYGESYLKAGEILESWGYTLKTKMNKNYLYA